MSKIKDLYKNDRPREKLINKGASGLKIYKELDEQNYLDKK